MTSTVTRSDIEDAYGRIKGHIRSTPVLELLPGIAMKNVHLSLKLELLQCTGSSSQAQRGIQQSPPA